MGSVVASRIGAAFRLRRNDMRVLVGCGAAGAIAAAFDAPLTGAFYGFELIIGIYSVATVAPVMAAALAADVVVRALGGAATPIDVYAPGPTAIPTFALFLVLGIVAAGVGIAIMRGVTLTETLIRRTRLPDYLRPALGGAVVAGLAWISPQVLSSGHGALHLQLDTSLAFWPMLFVFCLKATASAVSLGSGFRGGLFFASLFLGSLLGRLFYAVFLMIDPTTSLDPAIAAVVGMSALAVAVVGGPLTMTFLTLETTRDLTITGIVLTASLISALTVRRTFGYSFSTWRLHLRGETIRSAQDIGWMRSLTVGRMMRRDLRTILLSQSLAELRRNFPLGATQRVVVVDTDGRYQGIIDLAEAHAPERDAEAGTIELADLLHHQVDFLLPQMAIKAAVGLFDRTESEALAVVDNNKDRKVLGLLTEAHALKRYAEELDKARRSLAGES
jgi:CIC family chloride channel protein